MANSLKRFFDPKANLASCRGCAAIGVAAAAVALGKVLGHAIVKGVVAGFTAASEATGMTVVGTLALVGLVVGLLCVGIWLGHGTKG